MTQTHSIFAAAQPAFRLGLNHGYRIDGDLACLNAELAISEEQRALAQRWALQLWACDAPYGGGALRGTKVAEAPLELSPDAQPQQLYAEAFARLPAGGRDYSMVLVLASGELGAFDHVHDFANYPAREHFSVPSLRGAVAVTRDAEELTLHVERVENPRDAENLSGTLALEVWALAAAYGGGQFNGQPLAGVELGRLPGQQAIEQLERSMALAQAPAEHPHQVLMLREWTATGYVTRDFRELSYPAAAEPAIHAAAISFSEPAAEAAPEAAAAVIDPVAAAAEPVAISLQAADPAADSVSDVVASMTQTEPEQPMAAAAKALVSIQDASLEDLARVPGLNRKLAAEIVKARPFRSFDELLRVRGIGEKTLRRLRSVLTL